METMQQQIADPEKATMKPLKRKRVFVDADINPQEKQNLIEGFHDELSKLQEYFRSMLAWELGQEEGECSSVNSAIACMLEGSSLPFSKLACHIYEKLKERNGVSLASIQRDVHFIGTRLNYGVDNGNPNLLEDLSESCLWCWEVRDMKLIPKQRRKMCAAQRKGREKIRERLVALYEILGALRMPESEGNYKTCLLQASEKLCKTLNQEQICSVFEKMAQKNSSGINSNGKELLKEIEKNARIAEKEKKKHDRQLEKERCESEREAKRRQIEAEKEEKRRQIEAEREEKRRQIEAEREEKRREKEGAEQKKKMRRAREEAEREQKWREKEQTEAKKLLSVQKQATIMQRFLKSKKSNSGENQVNEFIVSCSSLREGCLETIISVMDSELSEENNINAEDLRRSHVAAWHGLRNPKAGQRWGVRRNPKAKIFTELKLQGSSCETAKSDSSRLPEAVEEDFGDGQPFDRVDDLTVSRNQAPMRAIKLLQFDKSHRPPYYGSWSQKSDVVNPRRPFAKDTALDYDVDSDEEWEEEEPGESLSDCDKDEDEVASECPGEGDDEDESDDGFFVPDGYLSESEGVQVDHSAEAQISSGDNMDMENEEFNAILQQQRYVDYLTQQALRRNQPLIISYLGRNEQGAALTKAEQICQLALCLVPFAGGSSAVQSIEDPDNSPAVSVSDVPEKVKEVTGKPGVTPSPVKGKRGRPKGKRWVPPASGTGNLPELLAAAAAAARKTAAGEELPECSENTQAQMS